MRANDACIVPVQGSRPAQEVAGIALACFLLASGFVTGCSRSTPPDEPASVSQADKSDEQRRQGVVADEALPVGPPAAPVHPEAPSGAPLTTRAADGREAAAALPVIDDLLVERSDQAGATLARMAAADPDARVREEAVTALGDVGGSEARSALELALIDPDRDVRKAAIEGLTALGGDESARALAIVQSDGDPRLRQDAVHALGEIGGATSTQLLRQALLDEDPAVRQAAAELLEQVPALPGQ